MHGAGDSSVVSWGTSLARVEGMRHAVITFAVLASACSSGPPCIPAFRWSSGAAPGTCELDLWAWSSDPLVTFEERVAFTAPSPLHCSGTLSVPCGPPGVTCTRTCTSLAIVADASASQQLLSALGTSNVQSDLRCGSLGPISADVIVATDSSELEMCAP